MERKRTRSARALILIVAAAIARPAPLEAQQPPPSGWQEFTQLFDGSLEHDRIVGGGVIVLQDGRPLARHEHGFADLASGARVNERTIFHYGSITKTLTAIAVMQLRDRGRLSLDDDVTRYVPELRSIHDPYASMDRITIRMLLSHCAGFQRSTWPYTQGKAWEPFEPTTWEQLVAMMPYQELVFKPGSRYGYSNPAFIYLARIVETLTGDSWETYVQKNIFGPLGLTRSYFGATPYYLAADRSHNYTVRVDSGTESVRDNHADFDPGITRPNSGWNAPLDDMVTYLAFLTGTSKGDSDLKGRYNAVLKRSSLEEMWRPLFSVDETTATPSGQSNSMGLSFFVLKRGKTTFIGHTGTQAGFKAFIYLNPSNGKAVAVSLNTVRDSPPLAGQPAFDTIRDAALRLLE